MPESPKSFEQHTISEVESFNIDIKMGLARVVGSVPVFSLYLVTRFEGDASNARALLAGGLAIALSGVAKLVYDSIEWRDGYYLPKNY